MDWTALWNVFAFESHFFLEAGKLKMGSNRFLFLQIGSTDSSCVVLAD
jgi:hypothetical protein